MQRDKLDSKKNGKAIVDFIILSPQKTRLILARNPETIVNTLNPVIHSKISSLTNDYGRKM